MTRKTSQESTRFRPKKRLGQHFLNSPQIIHKIIAGSGFKDSDVVLEIGSGKGALTIPLSRAAHHVIAVEKDPELIGWLEERLIQEAITNVTLLHDDILKFDFEKIDLPQGTKLKVIGNLPYNISTPFLDKLVENRARVSRATLMFQLEIAQRLTASPGSKSYGAMTVLVQYHAKAERLLAVSKSAFFPKPKVDSMVLTLDFERPHPNRAKNESGFKKVVKGAFSHRRKTLLNSLRGLYPSQDREKLSMQIEKCRIDPGTRAETLSIDDFVCLAAVIDIDTNAI